MMGSNSQSQVSIPKAEMAHRPERQIGEVPPVVGMRDHQFALNLCSNILNFFVTVLVGIWLVPYLIGRLDVAAYGLIPLATTMTSYLSLFTLALNSAVGRFMTIALDRRDFNEANRIFNTSFWGTSIILLLLLAPCIWFSSHCAWFLKIPPGNERDSAWLFLATAGIFYLTTLSSAFNVTAFCRNRFDLTNVVSIFSTGIRVVGVLSLTSLWAPRVSHVGVAFLIATTTSCVGAILIWRHLTPMLELRLRWFSLSALRQMTGMGGWIVIDQIGTILFLQIDLVVVNRVIGAEATGQYGAVMTWATLLRGLGAVVAGVFAPTIIRLYSRNDMDGLVRYSCKAVRFLGLTMALPVGLVCGLSEPLLYLWLGPTYASLAPLMSLMTIHLCVNLTMYPLYNIQMATGKVRVPALVTCVVGVFNLFLAWWLSGPLGWGMYGVALAGGVTLTCRNIVFVQLYAAHVLHLRRSAFVHAGIPAWALAVGLSGIGWCVARSLSLHHWIDLVVAGTVLSCLYLGAVFLILFRRDELGQVLELLRLPKISVKRD
jgi:membrane protein EpsK